VLGGSVRLRLDGEERLVEPQSWIQVPHGIVHTFGAGGRDPATFVNLHAPSCGLGTYMRGLMGAKGDEDRQRAWAGFDARATPEGGGLDPGGVVVCRLGGEGETITDRLPDRRVTLLADSGEIAVTESVYGPGERGPELHVHREHSDAWIVLEGALTFELRDEARFEAGAGSFVVVPPNVAHGFSNEGEATARFVNLHAPSCGFGEYLRGNNPDFDQHDPPPDGGLDPSSVIVRAFDN
jgi:quercetin dioxygenase-like cupin family protein